jgi:hypothetical protein
MRPPVAPASGVSRPFSHAYRGPLPIVHASRTNPVAGCRHDGRWARQSEEPPESVLRALQRVARTRRVTTAAGGRKPVRCSPGLRGQGSQAFIVAPCEGFDSAGVSARRGSGKTVSGRWRELQGPGRSGRAHAGGPPRQPMSIARPVKSERASPWPSLPPPAAPIDGGRTSCPTPPRPCGQPATAC